MLQYKGTKTQVEGLLLEGLLGSENIRVKHFSCLQWVGCGDFFEYEMAYCLPEGAGNKQHGVWFGSPHEKYYGFLATFDDSLKLKLAIRESIYLMCSLYGSEFYDSVIRSFERNVQPILCDNEER